MLPLMRFSALLMASLLAVASPATGSPQNTIAPIARQVIPTVVTISVRGQVQEDIDPLLSNPTLREFFGLQTDPTPLKHGFQTSGSGVIIDGARGYIVTNHHVIENADDIVVTLAAGGTFHAKMIGTDLETDIAVIQITAPNLKAIEFGDSRRLQVGDYVAAVGNPFGLGQTVTLGIVSALGRAGLGIDGYENFIQTDASLNPGNSGGPLIDMDGRLVGINSAIVAPSGGNIGIGFAIPVSMAKEVMDKLIKHGSIRRGRLGVVIQDLSPELAKALGVTADAGAVVSQVNGGSSAANAGLKAGDVIIAVDEDAIQNAAVLRNILGAHAPSERVQIRFRRGKDELHVQATLSDQERFAIPEVRKESLQGEGYLSGVVLASPDTSNNPEGIADGAIVVAVEDNCAAADAGLQAGDIIVAINQKSIHSATEVVRTAKEERDVLLLSVRRDGQTRFVAIGS